MCIIYLRDNFMIDYILSKFLKDVDIFMDFSVMILVKDFLWGNYVSMIVNKVFLYKRFFLCCVCFLYFRFWNM